MGAASFDLSALGEDGVQEGIEARILKDGKDRGELRFDVSFYPVLKPQQIDGGKEEELPDTSESTCSDSGTFNLIDILQRLESFVSPYTRQRIWTQARL